MAMSAGCRAEIDWEPTGGTDPAARRYIDVTVDAVVDRPAALSLRWREETSGQRRFKVARKIREPASHKRRANQIVSRQTVGT